MGLATSLLIVLDLAAAVRKYCPFHESSRRSDGSVLDDGKDFKLDALVQKIFLLYKPSIICDRKS